MEKTLLKLHVLCLVLAGLLLSALVITSSVPGLTAVIGLCVLLMPVGLAYESHKAFKKMRADEAYMRKLYDTDTSAQSAASA